MTDVTRRVRRRTAASAVSRGRRLNIVIEIEPPGNLIYFRLAGCRKRYALAVQDLLPLAMRAEVQARKELKRKAKEQRKKERSC